MSYETTNSKPPPWRGKRLKMPQQCVSPYLLPRRWNEWHSNAGLGSTRLKMWHRDTLHLPAIMLGWPFRNKIYESFRKKTKKTTSFREVATLEVVWMWKISHLESLMHFEEMFLEMAGHHFCSISNADVSNGPFSIVFYWIFRAKDRSCWIFGVRFNLELWGEGWSGSPLRFSEGSTSPAANWHSICQSMRFSWCKLPSSCGVMAGQPTHP